MPNKKDKPHKTPHKTVNEPRKFDDLNEEQKKAINYHLASFRAMHLAFTSIPDHEINNFLKSSEQDPKINKKLTKPGLNEVMKTDEWSEAMKEDIANLKPEILANLVKTFKKDKKSGVAEDVFGGNDFSKLPSLEHPAIAKGGKSDAKQAKR